MRAKPGLLFLSACVCVLAMSGCASSGSAVQGSETTAHASSGVITLDTPIHVHLFSTSDTDLGPASARDTANAMVKSAPHLLAVDIVDGLRRAGFTEVTLDESDGDPSAVALNLTGRFTVLNPGNQNLRLWIGFGAGKSKVSVEGSVVSATGAVLTEFSLSRSGLGWGASGPQLEDESGILGHSVADELVEWSGVGN